MRIDKTTSKRTEPHPDTAFPIYAAAESGQKQEPRKGGDGDDSSGGSDGSKKIAKKGEKLKEDMDALVEEIDWQPAATRSGGVNSAPVPPAPAHALTKRD